MAIVIFWASVAFVVYVYAVYPLLVAALARLAPRAPARAPALPSVTLVVPAYNEAGAIAEKIRNCLALDYPRDRLAIVVADDGSTDGTAEIAARAGDERVHVLSFPHRGKMPTINETVRCLSNEIVAFSDATSLLEPQALRALVASFGDPRVGAVSGVYRVRRAAQAALGVQEDFYWRYETFLKSREAELGVVLGAHGSLYAVRRALYPYPAASTINDDYVIPVRVLQRGYRVAYERGAVAHEEAQEMDGFGRRVRIMAGNIQQLREVGPLLWPPRPLALFVFLSHKAGRVLVPVAMIACLAANLALLEIPFYRVTLLLQAAFYGLAAAGTMASLRPLPLRLPYYFCLINTAALVAAFRLLARPGRLAWNSQLAARSS